MYTVVPDSPSAEKQCCFIGQESVSPVEYKFNPGNVQIRLKRVDWDVKLNLNQIKRNL